MESIFQTYTGSALLNNAIQTIESLTEKKIVTDINAEILLELYEKHQLWNLNRRLKSYTMIFSLNNPLVNPAKKELGWIIYDKLMRNIIKNHEIRGTKICELSGLPFDKTFSEFYKEALEETKEVIKKKKWEKIKEEKEIKNLDKTDISISRCWFPLIGSLGSDAQALPQAKFDVSINPICLAVIQFLPLSALIFKGGILLVDSINFEFSKEFIKENTKKVQKIIELTSEEDKIPNIKNEGRGDYVLRALNIYDEKKYIYGDDYSDLNLWSFSNSGTGARCEIERIPNRIFKNLLHLRKPSTINDLKKLLTSKIAGYFLDALYAQEDFWGLYPSKKQEGVGAVFFEEFQKIIGREKFLEYGKYIAYLINKDEQKKKLEINLLKKSDAYREPEYKTLFYAVLVRATVKEEWSLLNHLQILNDKNAIPINSNTYFISKLVHYFFQKKHFKSEIISPEYESSPAFKTVSLAVDLIENDERKEKTIKELTDAQNYKSFSFLPTLVRANKKLELSQIYELFFKNFKQFKFGLNDLLRIYFNQKEKQKLNIESISFSNNEDLKKYQNFAEDYWDYYSSKYCHFESGEIDVSKFKNHVLKGFPKSNHLINWFDEAIKRMHSFFKENRPLDYPIISKRLKEYENNLLYDDEGNFQLFFSRFAIHFSLNKIFSNHIQKIS